MNQISFSKYSKFIPYLYYLTIVVFWFTDVNRTEGLVAYPILTFGIPFIWQLIKPNHKLNAILGITFVCLSSYMIIAYLSDTFNIISISETAKKYLLYGGALSIANFAMAVWMVRNSIKRSF